MYESQHHINTSKNMARYKQVVRPHRRLQLVTVYKKVYFRVNTIASPPRSQPSSFHWMKVTKNCIARCILTYRVSLRAQGTKQQVIFHCTYACPKINHVMLWSKVTGWGSLASLSMICLASKILCQLVTFFGFAAVLSTCCCTRHVKEDDRVFQLFVLQRDKW
jgi:hypothetical protein